MYMCCFQELFFFSLSFRLLQLVFVEIYYMQHVKCNMLFLEKRCQMFMSKDLQIYDSVPVCLLGYVETQEPLDMRQLYSTHCSTVLE